MPGFHTLQHNIRRDYLAFELNWSANFCVQLTDRFTNNYTIVHSLYYLDPRMLSWKIIWTVDAFCCHMGYRKQYLLWRWAPILLCHVLCVVKNLNFIASFILFHFGSIIPRALLLFYQNNINNLFISKSILSCDMYWKTHLLSNFKIYKFTWELLEQPVNN